MTTRDEPRVMACLGLAVAVFASAVLVVLLAYGRGEFDDDYELSAVFPTSAQGVFTDGGTEVKLRGVPVGTVRGTELLDDARVRVTVRIDRGISIPFTTEARIEPLSVFGPKFVNLIPGTAEADGPYLADGDEIASASTGTDLTEILDGATGLFGAVDPVDLITIFEAISSGISGLGETIGAGIDNGSELVSVAHAHRDRVGSFLSDVELLSTTIENRSDRLVARLADYQALADLVAGRGQDIADLLDGTARIATTTSVLLDDIETDLDITLRTLAAVMAGIHEDRHLIPSAFDTVGAFFDMLGAGMRLPGPDGKKLTALKGFITADVCLVFGVCVLPDGGIQTLSTPTLAGSGPSRASTASSPEGRQLSELARLLVGSVGGSGS